MKPVFVPTSETRMLQALDKLVIEHSKTGETEPITSRQLIDAAGLGTGTGTATLAHLIEDGAIGDGWFGLFHWTKPKPPKRIYKPRGTKKGKAK